MINGPRHAATVIYSSSVHVNMQEEGTISSVNINIRYLNGQNDGNMATAALGDNRMNEIPQWLVQPNINQIGQIVNTPQINNKSCRARHAGRQRAAGCHDGLRRISSAGS